LALLTADAIGVSALSISSALISRNFSVIDIAGRPDWGAAGGAEGAGLELACGAVPLPLV